MDPRCYNNLIIPGWMVFELELKNSELRVYALIYGFSQGGHGDYHGSLQYLADWCGMKHRCNAVRVLKRLQAKGLLYRYSDKVISTHGKVKTIIHYQARMPQSEPTESR